MADKPRPSKRPRLAEFDSGNNSEQEISSEVEPLTPKRAGYSQYFRYENQDGPCGVCLLCEKNKSVKIIRMKQNNTSGLTKHLGALHKLEFFKTFGHHPLMKGTSRTRQKKFLKCSPKM